MRCDDESFLTRPWPGGLIGQDCPIAKRLKTGKRWDPDNFSEELREFNSAADLVWSCLDFRHPFGSHLAQKGESLYHIATLMGNSPEICRRHYAALIPEQMHDVVEFKCERPPTGNGQIDALLRQVLDRLNQVVPRKNNAALRLAQ